MIVDIFIPCYIDQHYPRVAEDMVKVLEYVGCGVNYNQEQTCCGLPAFHEGFHDYCKDVGEKLICEFQNERYIVSPGGSCVNMVKNYYPEIFHNSSMHNEYKHVQKYMYEFSEFLVKVMNVTDTGASLRGTAVMLDNCSALNECGISESPRQLLGKVRNLKLVELPEKDNCCGWGNSFATQYEDIAVKMAEKMLQQIKKSGAEIVTSTDIGCLMHLEGVMKMRGDESIRVMHLTEVLASR